MLRKAEIGDREFLVTLRGHPEIYKNCGRARALTKEEFLQTLTDDTTLFVIMEGDVRAGYIRFDPFDDELIEIGIAIDPAFWGQGVATRAIAEGVRLMQNGKKFIAKVKTANNASQRIFLKNNFVEVKRDDDYIFYIK